MDAIAGNLIYDLFLVFPCSLVIWSVLLERRGLPDADRPWWMRLYVRWHEWGLARAKRRSEPTTTPWMWMALAFINAGPVAVGILAPTWGFRSSVPRQPVFAIWIFQIAALCLEAGMVGPSWVRIRRRETK